jgi:hypothetical protein
MVQPHGDVKPVEERRLGDAGLDQDRAQPGAAIGERRQLGILGLADLLEAAPDQRLDCGVCFRDRGENLPAAVRRLDISKADFEMPLAVLTAPDEG